VGGSDQQRGGKRLWSDPDRILERGKISAEFLSKRALRTRNIQRNSLEASFGVQMLKKGKAGAGTRRRMREGLGASRVEQKRCGS